ncbi:APC family permease [Paraburkholderia dipogonis]|uniref:APC family permease n=1 Tax=Paraburkholderia dipogonis TaxID=1211383 RepID=UPI00141B8F27|nr:APC family permease [Paraburkholderia dipogonis]
MDSATIENSPRRLTGNMGAIGLALTVLAFSAPLTTVSGYIPFALAFGGVASPLIFLVTAVVLLLFSVGYVTLNNIVKRPGDFYAFVSYGIGKSTGLGSGILAAVAYFLLLSGVTSFFGVSCSDLVHSMTGANLPWFWPTLGCWLVVAILGYLHVELSAKVLTWVMMLEILVCLAFSFGVVFKGGVPGIAASAPFNPHELSHSSHIPFSMLFVMSFFTGFEATALFRDEVKLPDQTIPRATYGAVIFIGVIYTFCAYAMIMAYGTNVQDVAAKTPAVMFPEAFSKFVDPRLHTIVTILVMTSAFAAALSNQNVLSRYLHNLGTDGAVPGFLGQVHPKHQSPYLASMTTSTLVLCTLIPFIPMGTKPDILYGALSGLGTSGVIILMAIVNFASLAWYVRSGRKQGTSFAKSFLAPAISSVFFIALVVLVALHFDVLAGGEPGQYTWLFYCLIGVQLGGMVLAQYFKRVRPDVFRRLGRSHHS